MSEAEFPWVKTDDGYSTFVAELLPVGGNSFQLPDTQEIVSLKTDFKSHRDQDYDLTHWTLERNGVSYVVFND